MKKCPETRPLAKLHKFRKRYAVLRLRYGKIYRGAHRIFGEDFFEKYDRNLAEAEYGID